MKRPNRTPTTSTRKAKLQGAIQSLLSFRTLVQVLKLAHFASYAHAQQVRLLTMGEGVQMAPNVSFRNAKRIEIGSGSHIGEYSVLWAGNSHGKIVLGQMCLLGPHVTISASNYGIVRGLNVMDQDKVEQDIEIGSDVWLGANSIVLAGVRIGEGAIVAAGAVVSRDLPAQCIAAGVPARVIGMRPSSVRDSR